MRSLIGKQAPKFSAAAVVNGHEIVDNFSLEQYKGNKYVVFFFYPMDFTFVCPTELHAFQEKLAEFEKANAGNLSIDAGGNLAYLAPNRVNLGLTQERWPDIVFHETREHAVNLND